MSDFLELNSLKPFSQLCDLSSYAFHHVFMELTTPRIGWNQEMTTISVDGEEIQLDLIKTGIQKDLEDLTSSILDLTREDEISDWLSFPHGKHQCIDPIMDNPHTLCLQYSFLDDNCFQNVHLTLLRHLIEHPNWFIGVLNNMGH